MMINENMLLHLYGFSNGLYIAAFFYLLFFALSYYSQKNRKISMMLIMLAVSTGLFGLYNLFTQHVFSAPSSGVVPAYLLMLGKFGAPFALSLLLHMHTKMLAGHSFYTYSVVKRNIYWLYLIHAVSVLSFVLLLFASSEKQALLILHFMFIPTVLLSMYWSAVTQKTVRYSRLLFVLLSICACSIIYMIVKMLIDADFQMPLLAHLYSCFVFGCVLMAYSFICIRFSDHEAKRLFQLKDSYEHSIAMDLNQAIANNHLYMLYQPKLDLQQNSISGLEALVRWQHPKRGLISPKDFIPIVEKTGMIDDVCFWVVETVIKQAADFHRQKIHLPISINFSTHNLKPKVVHFLSQMLENYAVPASLIQIEITETLLLDITDDKRKALEMLKALNIGLSMDDYGTGYSSLSYIKKLSLKELKIDASFVRDLDTRIDNMVIVDSIIQMSKSLNIHVTAEGVETQRIQDILQDMGCHTIQGYLLTKPSSIPSLMLWMQQKNMVPSHASTDAVPVQRANNIIHLKEHVS